MSNPLGNFRRIPPEIRHAIWDLLVPEEYGQYFRFHSVTDELVKLPNAYSDLPALAAASMELRTELLCSIPLRRDVEVYVNPRGFTSNFPIKALGLKTTNSDSSASTTSPPAFTIIPPCKSVTFSIDVLAPRTASNAIETRRNNALLVQLLNRHTSASLPHITVQLITAPDHSLFNCSVNDFAMLVGPFVYLEKAANGFKICHFPRVMAYHAPLDAQCRMIESSAVKENVGHEMAYQQLMLDIKLPLTYWYRYDQRSSTIIQRSPRPMQEAKAVLAATKQLQKLYEEIGKPEPEWLNELKVSLESGMIVSQLRKELAVKMLEGSKINAIWYWAAGLMTCLDCFKLTLH